MRERQIHDAFNVWLRERGIPFIESRMDRKSTIAKAWPDYTLLFMGRVLCIEVKTEKGRLRADQVKMIEFIRRSGNRVEVCRSVTECVEAATSILCTGETPATSPTGGCNYPLEGCFLKLKAEVAAVPEATPVNGKLVAEIPPAGLFKKPKREFIATVFGQDKVCFGDPEPGGDFTILRAATPSELVSIPRR